MFTRVLHFNVLCWFLWHKMSLVIRKLQSSLHIHAVWSASDQHLCFKLLRKQNTCTCSCNVRNFKTLASLCSWADQFEYYLVTTPRRQVFSWCGSNYSFWTMPIKLVGHNIHLVISENMWAVTWQNQQNAQRRLRSAWASDQSDQSLLSAWRKLGSLATH